MPVPGYAMPTRAAFATTFNAEALHMTLLHIVELLVIVTVLFFAIRMFRRRA